MAEPIIHHLLPSQQCMSKNDIVEDCLEKLRVLALVMPEGKDYLSDQMLHQYANLMDDLIEIAIFNHQTREIDKSIN